MLMHKKRIFDPNNLFQHREKLGKKMEKYVKKREDMVAQGVVSTVKPV